MKVNGAYIGLAVMIGLSVLTGCTHDKGDCVLVSANSWDQQIPVRADYIKFSSSSHWYSVNGETRSILGAVSSVTACEK